MLVDMLLEVFMVVDTVSSLGFLLPVRRASGIMEWLRIRVGVGLDFTLWGSLELAVHWPWECLEHRHVFKL